MWITNIRGRDFYKYIYIIFVEILSALYWVIQLLYTHDQQWDASFFGLIYPLLGISKIFFLGSYSIFLYFFNNYFLEKKIINLLGVIFVMRL